MELIAVASSGDGMITNAAVSPTGRLFGNFPRWTALLLFPNSQAPRVNRPYEVFKIPLP